MPPQPTPLAEPAAHVLTLCSTLIGRIADELYLAPVLDGPSRYPAPPELIDLWATLEDAADRLWYLDLDGAYAALAGLWRRLPRGLDERLRVVEERLTSVLTVEDA